MAEDAGDAITEGRLDLVPMIDCIMLLLIFLILTTKFSTEEKAIGSLLPTDKGQLATKPKTPPQERKEVNITIVPNMELTRMRQDGSIQPTQLRNQFRENVKSLKGNPLDGLVFAQGALLRIGQNDPLEIKKFSFDGRVTDEAKATVEAIHGYIHGYLAQFEEAGKSRKEQVPINIHCFSGLSWGYALVAYDAVRAYEAKLLPRGGGADARDPLALKDAREVNFAPPQIRDFSVNELGYEIDNMLRMK
jgi:biopolymer transport protein ExbD